MILDLFLIVQLSGAALIVNFFTKGCLYDFSREEYLIDFAAKDS